MAKTPHQKSGDSSVGMHTVSGISDPSAKGAASPNALHAIVRSLGRNLTFAVIFAALTAVVITVLIAIPD
ncbi:hypothetical protein AF71_00036650 [Rhizobium sp. 57MFTsu3.2]|nr:hypothetical protein [Rhizobium sp. 57MFTsu3.2]